MLHLKERHSVSLETFCWLFFSLCISSLRFRWKVRSRLDGGLLSIDHISPTLALSEHTIQVLAQLFRTDDEDGKQAASSEETAAELGGLAVCAMLARGVPAFPCLQPRAVEQGGCQASLLQWHIPP